MEWIWISFSQVGEPRACFAEWSKTERENEMLYIDTHVSNLEKWSWWTHLQSRNTDTDVKNCLRKSQSNKVDTVPANLHTRTQTRRPRDLERRALNPGGLAQSLPSATRSGPPSTPCTKPPLQGKSPDTRSHQDAHDWSHQMRDPF